MRSKNTFELSTPKSMADRQHAWLWGQKVTSILKVTELSSAPCRHVDAIARLLVNLVHEVKLYSREFE